MQRRLEQIDQLTELVRGAEQRSEHLRSLGDAVLANHAANIAMAVLAYKSELVRRERRKAQALEALVESRMCG